MTDLSPEQQSKILQKKVSSLFKEIQGIKDAAKAAEEDSKHFPAFRGRFRELQGLHNEYIQGWDKLYELYILMDKEKDFPFDEKYLKGARTYLYECNTVYENVMNPAPPPLPRAGTGPSAASTFLDGTASASQNLSLASFARSRLPKIHIPSFQGELMEWPKFRDVFVSLVHEEDVLTPIEKFHHLIGALSGEPLRLVSNFPITAVNYDNAWKTLNKRYNNKRILAAAYLHRIRQFKPLNQSSSNSSYLRSFLKLVAESFTALSSLEIPNEADFLKLQLALDCLDPDIRQLYEEKQQGQEFPTYASLVEFIQQRCQILELSEPLSATSHVKSNHPSRRPNVLATFASREPTATRFKNDVLSKPSARFVCPNCKKDHLLFRCYAFKNMSPAQRMNFARSIRICFNCLREGHVNSDCPSTYTCLHCKGRHHSLLHDPTSKPNHAKTHKSSFSLTSSSAPNAIEEQQTSGIVGTTAGCNTVLLGTAVVNIRDWKGSLQPVRIVIDSGSQFSVMTSDCARRLGLQWVSSKRSISGIGLTQLPPSKGAVHCCISPVKGEGKTVQTKALIMPIVTSNLPTTSLQSSLQNHFRTLNLADENFWESRPIEFLLGSDLFLEIMLEGPMVKISDQFGALPTIFGHIVMGVPPRQTCLNSGTCLALTDYPVSDTIMRKFWELEEPSSSSDCIHPEEMKCEEHFKANVQRLPTGRYMVALPFKDSKMVYPGSKFLALSRFRNLEQRFTKHPILKQQYDEFMEEYVQLEHMEIASTESAYLIPHHAVFKRASEPDMPDKIRVVFDASMKTSSGSLNDNLLIGAKLQRDISTIILNFRKHRIVFCADIVKMFRQILIAPEHRRYQHILWRFSSEDAIQTFELRTLTYGQASSPFLALRVLEQLAEDEGAEYPEAAIILRRDVYVDDIITGADSLDDALKRKTQIISLLEKGGFPVHKWSSNSHEFLKTIPEEPHESQVCLLPKDAMTKILGMHWDANTDCFRYEVQLTATKITKRSMLSVVARLFDPLGLLAPTIFRAKFMIQGLWLQKLDWDEAPSAQIIKDWTEFIEDLPHVRNIVVPRWVRASKGMLKLFGFCDASEKGYAAAIYLRVEEPNSDVNIFLLTAKSRLAPLKTATIPRLELCAAHLLTKLLRSIEEFRKSNEIDQVFLFSDSTIVLSWLQMAPYLLKTFVANRVGYILSHTQINQWHHVPSLENPADIASRGILASNLLQSTMWWEGPKWMSIQPLTLPISPLALVEVPERKISAPVLMSTLAPNFADSIIEKFSDFMLMIGTIAYVFRFINNARITHKLFKERTVGALTVEELEKAKHYLIQESQRDHFSADFDFQTQTCISSRFKALMVFKDSSGVLRVGGRLAHSLLTYDTKHPILLSHTAKLTDMIIDHIHQQNFHLGPKALQAYLQRKYYIFRIRSLVRKRVWNCLRCYRLNAKPNNPFMADLPISRVSQGRPFISVGVDFAGPFLIKQSQRRNSPTVKGYLCIFVCLAVKAVHMELVSALSTKAFLAAFDRFVARRGLPSDISSDCGTNFVGAARHLKELYNWYNDEAIQETIGRYTSRVGVQWHFNPPYAPHFGGVWEAAVKSAKSHLRRTLGDRPFYFEELTTIFARIEAVLNSRPLCPVTSNPNDFDYLSPGHFLIGSALIAPPERDLRHIDLSRQSRWQLLQSSVQIFWKRWANEYVHTLQRRPKWTNSTPPIKIGDMVILQEPHIQPLNWRLGRIAEVHPGLDQTIRVATVTTASGIVKRAVHRLVPLAPINDSA